MVALIGLATTSSSILEAAMGLYVPTRKLAYEGAPEFHARGFSARLAWAFVVGGFGFGAVIYYVISLFLDQKGAVLRSPTRFREYLES
jgi:hypothetical protein